MSQCGIVLRPTDRRAKRWRFDEPTVPRGKPTVASRSPAERVTDEEKGSRNMISKTTVPSVASPARTLVGGLTAAAGLAASTSLAAASQPVPWQIGLQPGASAVRDHIESFAAFTFWIIIPITLFVLGLLIWVMVKFNAKANPVPSKTTHHTGLEIAWTVVPILILVALAIPSFRLLYEEMVVPPADVTIKVTGYQWYWGYEYTDLVDDKKKALSFDSVMLDDTKRKDPVRQPRLLAVDNEVIVPVGKVVRLQLTGADVIHSWALPAFGVKMDANPGRLNETWFKAEKTGVFYGQCSELCGRDHAFMPIAVNVVTPDKFDAWAKTAKTDLDAAYRQLAAAVDAEGEQTRLAAR